jgi:hypothetical protein
MTNPVQPGDVIEVLQGGAWIYTRPEDVNRKPRDYFEAGILLLVVAVVFTNKWYLGGSAAYVLSSSGKMGWIYVVDHSPMFRFRGSQQGDPK